MATPQAPSRSRQRLLIATFDVAGFVRAVRSLDDEAISGAVDSLYLAVGAAVAGAGGRVVKYLGDGALAVWPPEHADRAVAAALALRGDVRRRLASFGVAGELEVTFHCGEVVAGEFEPDRRFDVIGREVFVAFLLPVRTMSLSAEAYRLLTPEMQARFTMHSEPVVYVPSDDPGP